MTVLCLCLRSCCGAAVVTAAAFMTLKRSMEGKRKNLGRNKLQLSRSAASQINQMKCQHVIAVSPAIVAAWTKWHVHQAAGTGDVKLLETDN